MRGMLCLAAAVLAASVAFGAGPFAGKLVFTSTRDGNAEIYVINADGTNLLRLTNNKATDDEPVLSPDGSKVVFVSDRDGNSEIYLADADGKNLKRLTKTDYPELDPSFTPDGLAVVYTSMAEGEKDIWRMNLADGSVVKLVTDAGDQFNARMAADGALVYGENGGNPEIVFRTPDGTERNLSNFEGWDLMPTFSPDGQTVYFISVRSGDYDVYAVNRDGTGLRAVTTFESLEGRPAPSPDGQYLAIPSDMDGDLEIYIFTVQGEKLVQLTDGDADDYEPNWSK